MINSEINFLDPTVILKNGKLHLKQYRKPTASCRRQLIKQLTLKTPFRQKVTNGQLSLVKFFGVITLRRMKFHGIWQLKIQKILF